MFGGSNQLQLFNADISVLRLILLRMRRRGGEGGRGAFYIQVLQSETEHRM